LFLFPLCLCPYAWKMVNVVDRNKVRQHVVHRTGCVVVIVVLWLVRYWWTTITISPLIQSTRHTENSRMIAGKNSMVATLQPKIYDSLPALVSFASPVSCRMSYLEGTDNLWNISAKGSMADGTFPILPRAMFR
jgi:hypothetical protein